MVGTQWGPFRQRVITYFIKITKKVWWDSRELGFILLVNLKCKSMRFRHILLTPQMALRTTSSLLPLAKVGERGESMCACGRERWQNMHIVVGEDVCHTHHTHHTPHHTHTTHTQHTHHTHHTTHTHNHRLYSKCDSLQTLFLAVLVVARL